ncbi:DUF2093 domain-containing protein [Hirschia baltica]|uniref:DUF2093 domain-containing protein n=1 Tax=Hirschia baltica (strain ATCC 49814 / DSM 5838 / IFAM 1418) TaxID=582402 RepID=C6XQT6_HIRBI|nr:DUF2093 domain-containing protein [Hirschia baltica]ACT58692.1 conserved hypothetical protein [Hirschia baltica ATCC 49814]
MLPSGLPGEAKIKYLDADFEILKMGKFVICAVTNEQILLEDLKYWSVDLQEPYVDAEAAVKRWKEMQPTA